jgi:hypothetical protein
MGTKQVMSVVAASVLFLFVAGCSDKASLVKSGELFEVVSEIREKGEVQWKDNSTESFDCVIPQGTVVKVLYNQRSGIEVFECEPVKIDGKEDADYILSRILPQRLQGRYDMEGVSLSMKAALIGKELKKVQ